MSKYEIKRWDPVKPGNNHFPYPMIYIKPDDRFISYAERNNYILDVKVENSGSLYDNKNVKAIVDSSGRNRPNFYNKTGYYALTLDTEWKGYPSNNGSIAITGMGIIPLSIIITEPYSNNRLSTTQIGLILLGLFLFFALLLLCLK